MKNFDINIVSKGNGREEKRFVSYVRLWFDAFCNQRDVELTLDDVAKALRNITSCMAEPYNIRLAINDQQKQVIAIRDLDNEKLLVITKNCVDKK